MIPFDKMAEKYGNVHMNLNPLFLQNCLNFVFQNEFEVNISKIENDARNQEKILRDEIQQLQTELDAEKVSYQYNPFLSVSLSLSLSVSLSLSSPAN